MKSTIDLTIQYIENILLSQMINKSSVTLHLVYIKSILKQSEHDDESINIAKILEAIHYIEGIKIENKSFFFNSEKILMANLLHEHEEIILPAHERKQKTTTFPPKELNYPVSPNTHTIFGRIHNTLIDLVQDRLQFEKNAQLLATIKRTPPIWNYKYAAEEGGVMNQAIGEWQAAQMEPLEPDSDAKKAFIDFIRAVSIRGMTGKSFEEVADLLSFLVSAANYSSDEKKLITHWLEHKGGQDNNRFLDFLLMQGEYTNGDHSALLKSRGVEQNWTLENGKIVLFYDCFAYALVINGDVKVNDGFGRLINNENPETIDLNSNLPVMRIRAKIELHIDSNQAVIPQITFLNAISYSPDLKQPAPLLNQQLNL